MKTPNGSPAALAAADAEVDATGKRAAQAKKALKLAKARSKSAKKALKDARKASRKAAKLARQAQQQFAKLQRTIAKGAAKTKARPDAKPPKPVIPSTAN